MEKEERKWEEDGEEEDEEEEEVLRGRQPRNHNRNTAILTDTTSSTGKNGNGNGNGIHSSVEDDKAEDSSLIQQEGPEELKISKNDDLIDKVIGVEDEKQRSEKCVYDDNAEGTGFTYGLSVTALDTIECSAPEKNPGEDGKDVPVQSFDTVVNHQYDENLKHDGLYGSNIRPSEISFEETNYKYFTSKAIESANLIRESDHEVTEFDVERVLEKQDTHDLYCPNCNSCITRRVILRKRKRKIQTSGEDTKRNKSEIVIASDLDAISVDATSDQGRNAVEVVDYDRDREPDIFRCLSCFSIFIPTGTGSKLFWMFGNNTEKKNMQDPQQIPTMKKRLFSSIFASDKGEVLIEQGTSHRADVENNNGVTIIPSSHLNEQNSEASSMQEDPSSAQTFVVGGLAKSLITESWENGENILNSSTEGPAKLIKEMVHVGEKLYDATNKSKGAAALDYSEVNTANQLNTSSFFKEKLSKHESDYPGTTFAGETPRNIPAEISIFIPQQDGLTLIIPSNVGSLIVKNSLMDQNCNVAVKKKSSDGAYPSEFSQNNIIRTKVDIQTEKPFKVDGDVLISSVQDALLVQEGLVSIGKNLKDMPTESSADGTYPSELSQNNFKTKVEIDTEKPMKVDKYLLISSVQDALLVRVGQVSIGTISKDMPAESNTDGAFPPEFAQNNIIRTQVDIHTEKLSKVDRDILISKVQDALSVQGGRASIGTFFKDLPAESNAGKDTVIIVESGQAEPETSQRAQNITVSAETGASSHIETQIQVVEQEATTAREVRELDIIKSIVYGGLIESITSLGVVSSAAGADATTLNVLALGLANLFGGLFLIGHGLWDLKNDHSGGQVDRYQELLGRREDFLLHAVVAVVSFLTFGLLPPVIYGFSFRKSDDRDLKLVTVAAASLLCIIMLAAGKVYVKRPPKSYLKTLVYYICTGVMASGVSFVVGSLIRKLLEKLGLFQSSLVVTLPLPEMRSMSSGWASY